MAFQGGDARNRRNILQGLQQTKSRLQRLHSDGPTRTTPSPLYPSPHQRSSHSPAFPQTSSARPAGPGPGAGMMGAASRMGQSSPSPNEYASLLQQQKLQMQASAQSFSFFITQHSLHGNLIMPVLPRFDSNGQLDTSAS